MSRVFKHLKSKIQSDFKNKQLSEVPDVLRSLILYFGKNGRSFQVEVSNFDGKKCSFFEDGFASISIIAKLKAKLKKYEDVGYL